jgi:hypothetical protein
MNFHEEKEEVALELPDGRIVVLTVNALNTEMDTEEILRIDYSNIMGEILTFPVMFNRIANLRATLEEAASRAKTDMDIFEHQLREEKRKKLEAGADKRVTDTMVETAIKIDARYKQKKDFLFRRQRDLGYAEALYWSAQSKDTKLNRLSEKMRPEDFSKELLEDNVNGVYIKITQPVIK